MLYLRFSTLEASPKAISRRTSYLRVRLEFLPYPHLIATLFNGCAFGPPFPFTGTSTWTWIGHPVSGLWHATLRALHPRFPCGSVTESLNLAAYYNSPDRSTKSTTSHLNVLCVLVNTRFQVLFHSPPGVLFTFPSRYCSSIGHQVVFRLGGWSPRLLTGFLVSADTKDTVRMLPRFVYRTLTVSGRLSHAVRLRLHNSTSRSIPRKYYYFRFRLFRFRSPLLAESRLISFPPGT